MTLPDERYHALIQTRTLLFHLCSPHMTPRVPRAIRERAMNLLRHFPTDYHLEMMTIHMPNDFAKEIEPVTRMFMKYEDKDA
ncbi:hypothetical protein EBU71_19125 [bacterium]|nr:hypothetical protein [Candidatus Elulimicrobium humile]